MQYLLDSDWAIEYLKGTERFVNRVTALEPGGIAIGVIALAELYEGAIGARDRAGSERELVEFVDRIELLGVDLDTSRLFGVERHRLRAEGRMIGDMDLLIAATALRHDLTLLTNNRRHFERIPNLVIESV